MFCRSRAVQQTGTHVRAGSARRRFSTCARRGPVRPDRQKSAAGIFARKPRSSRVQSKCVASFPKIENDGFRLNLQMFKKSTGALALSFLLVLESSARKPQKHLPATPLVENKIVRARDLGIPFEGTPGKFNAITDVAGVEVGYTTLISGEGKLEVGKGPVRTGVTVIIPRGHDSLNDPVYAGFFSLNGNGEMTGTAWVEESGFLEGPIVITNTHSVGVARDAVIAWRINHGPADKTGYWWSLPVVAETWDGWLNDINGFHVKPEDVWHALDTAHGGAIEEGSVGGGTGMICYEFKGGNGTASRKVEIRPEGADKNSSPQSFLVGVFLQPNFC